MRAADWIGQRLKKEADIIFGVTGGCIINAVDGFFKQGLKVIPMHHEQAAAMAADGYARMSGKLGLCYATSGPGGQNLITGIACAYYDSVPILAIMGQVPAGQYNKTCAISGLRQFGFQETHNADISVPVSKYAVNIDHADRVATQFEICIAFAKLERKGPTVIDICDDVQRQDVQDLGESHLKDIARHVLDQSCDYDHEKELFEKTLSEAITNAKRPVLLLGSGIMQSGQEKATEEFVKKLGFPVLLSWGAKELMDEANPYYIGGFGIAAERTGNYVLKHTDLILSIGCRLDTHGFGSSYKWLEGKKIIAVDIDQPELEKLPDIVTKIHADIRDAVASDVPQKDWSKWLNAIITVRRRFPICQQIKNYDDGWDPYTFIRLLSDLAGSNTIIVGDAGQTLSWLFQAWETKLGQRLFSDFNNSCMGYSLPAAIGAAFACPDRPVYCVMGDGSFMMNIQELQTVTQHHLNIKIIIINNGGYGMIMQTQSDWESLSQGVSCNKDGGLTFPDYKKVAYAFDIPYLKPENTEEIEKMALTHGPMIVDAKIIYGSKISPKLLWGDDLWNQKPYLSDEEKTWIDKTLLKE